MKKILPFALWALALAAFCATALAGQEETPAPHGRLVPFARGIYSHQFEADIDGGGDFSVDRIFVQGGATYFLGVDRNVTLALGMGTDSYHFSAESGLAGHGPWQAIRQYRASAPVRWGVDDTWTVFVLPTIRFAAEEGGDLSKSVFGGGFAGVSRKVSDRLTIGPGVGVITMIEDNPSIIPVVLIDWEITDGLTLGTGSGLATTQGPGLSLKWKAAPEWLFYLGGRYERLRFRLDDKGEIRNGIGDDRCFPVFGGLTWEPSRNARLGVMGGVELAGELRLEDENGHTVSEANTDPAPFAGFDFSVRF